MRTNNAKDYKCFKKFTKIKKANLSFAMVITCAFGIAVYISQWYVWQMLLKNGSVAVMSIAAAMVAVLAKAMKTKLLIKIMII